MTRWPAEWEPHQAVWIGFPGDPAEWPVGREAAQREVAAFANAVADDGAGEKVVLVCRDTADADVARGLVQSCVDVVVEPFGDVWLRDSAPVFVAGQKGLDGRNFRFNGWGGKYEMAGDQDIGERLAVRPAGQRPRLDIGRRRYRWRWRWPTDHDCAMRAQLQSQ